MQAFQRFLSAAFAAGRPRWDWKALNPFGDFRVQFGIKVGLAMLLALWVAQVLRLEYPNWAALTVLVLMNAQYVGATGTKALMRAIGTVAGALLGVWAVGNFASAPLVFLFWVFIVVVIATYKFGQLASASAPYAYFLTGMTLVSVSTYGLPDPNQVWRVALLRTLETLVGVVSATFVTSVIWPRHAREAFVQEIDAALKTVRSLLSTEVHAYLGEAVDLDRVGDLRGKFGRQLATLRTLLQTGSSESAQFRARLGNYQRFIVAMTHLFQAVLELQRRRSEEMPVLERIRPELDRIIAAVDAELGILSTAHSTHGALPTTDLKAAFSALAARVKELRDQGTFRTTPLPAGEAFFGHFATLRLINEELSLLRDILGELPRLRLPPPTQPQRRPILPSIDPFWVKAGVKGAISVCLAFVLVEWLQPPGSTAIPLCAYIFSIFGRTFVRSGGTGDQRVFQNVFLAFLLVFPVVALLWLILPLLSNYWAMNVFLFVVCYAYGYFTAGKAGVSFPQQVIVLAINVLVGLNPQKPVPSHSVMDSFLGLVTGMGIAAVVARLLWPVLPQGILRSDLVAFFDDLRKLSGETKDREAILTRTVLLPGEALQAAESMSLPRCAPDERGRLSNFIRVAQPLGMQITVLREVRARPLPAAAAEMLREPLRGLDAAYDDFLARLAECFGRRTTDVHFPDVDGSLEAVDAAAIRIRDEGVLAQEDVDAVAHLLELVDRCHAIAERLWQCRDGVRTLRLDRYLGDVAL
ncbi:MAG TPA: FUSC family protein [Chthoniobacterales bacterium]